VSPERCLFLYETTTSCDCSHGLPVRSLNPAAPPDACYSSVKEALVLDGLAGPGKPCWLPPPEQYWEHDALVRAVGEGKATGFVTVVGGRESPEMLADDPAGSRFGFCVLNYAPTRADLSPYTVREIALHHGFLVKDPKQKQQQQQQPMENEDEDEEMAAADVDADADAASEKAVIDWAKLDDWLSKQPGRTLNASSFLTPETVSTTYLAWLMKARKFVDFQITHYLAYSFCDWGSDYLLPLLQSRHEKKLQGDAVAAECLKLLGNGSFGYNGLESCNYDDLKLFRSSGLDKILAKQLAPISVKHLTHLGPICLRQRASKKKNKKSASTRWAFKKRPAPLFVDSEAVDDDDDEEEEEEEEEESDDDDENLTSAWHLSSSTSNAAEETGSLAPYNWKRPVGKHSRPARAVFEQAPWEENDGSCCDEQTPDSPTSPPPASSGDLEELAVRRSEAEHSYARSPTSARPEAASETLIFDFLTAVVLSGSEKQIFNSLARAVAVLSNSKRLFLSHLDVLFRCLDPRKAELCYVDTDSCVWSLTHDSIDRCLLPEKLECWRAASILADERGSQSCHGKLKLEGLFSAGLFKTMKIYRLFEHKGSASTATSTSTEDADFCSVYTRCKGINRKRAPFLPDSCFEVPDLAEPAETGSRLVVHRRALRPAITGEMLIVHEARSLAAPFNMKRYVTPDGLHSLPFGRHSDSCDDRGNDYAVDDSVW
jgi:hypothetical protein